MGVFIVVDGIDGCGKSTQVKLLVEDMKKCGIKAMTTKWKDSSSIQDLFIGDIIKRIHDGEAIIPPEARTFLLGADISYRLESRIKQGLNNGFVVIGDRYIYKVIAQGVARGLELEWVRNLFKFAIEPDIKILIDVSSETACERITEHRNISFYEAGLDVNVGGDRKKSFIFFQNKVRKSLLDLAKSNNMVVVDGSKSIEEQHKEILGYVSKILDEKNVKEQLTCLGHDE